MQLSRRELAAAGVLALGAANLLSDHPALAEAGDEAAVKQSVEALREALLKADKPQLERLTADQVSYGHSDGRVQDKPEFINGVMTRKATVKSMDFPDLKGFCCRRCCDRAPPLRVGIGKPTAKPTMSRSACSRVWQKQGGNWKLLARQGYKLA